MSTRTSRGSSKNFLLNEATTIGIITMLLEVAARVAMATKEEAMVVKEAMAVKEATEAVEAREIRGTFSTAITGKTTSPRSPPRISFSITRAGSQVSKVGASL